MLMPKLHQNSLKTIEELLSYINKNINISINSKNTANICLYIIYKLDLQIDLETLSQIYFGALIHDIGKTKISKHILNKIPELTNEEKEIIKQHTNYGVDIIDEVIEETEGMIPSIIKNIVLYHHEYLDGSGYHGMTDIPYYAQLVCVADMYDGMSNNRNYRKALHHNEIMNILTNDAELGKINKQFVEALTDYRKDKYLFNDFLNMVIK